MLHQRHKDSSGISDFFSRERRNQGQMEKHGKKLNMTLQQRLQECLAAQLVGDKGK